jgi:putative ABC transport system permease protein
LEGKPLPQGFFITTTLDDPSAADLDGVIDDLNEVMLENGIPVSAFNFVDLTDQISAAFTTIQVILQAVASLIALVGALGLLTTLSMSVFERQKEIGVMRSIGASSGTVVTQFLTEGLVVGIIAWIVGLPLAYLIEVGLLSVTGFDETFKAVFPVSAAIIGLVGMLLITALASLWPSLSAARKTVSDILRYQ